MQVHHPRGQLAILRSGWRRILVPSFPRKRIVEGPVLHISLTALHDGAPDAGVPGLPIVTRVGLREMQMRIRHPHPAADAAETEITIGALEAEGMRGRDFTTG